MKKNIIILILSCFVVVLVLLLWKATENQSSKNKQMSKMEQQVPQQTINSYENAEIITSIIPSENNTFGYDIYVDSILLIHQISKPGIAGNEGFSTKEQAQQVANLVVKKIRNNEMPPTVTTEELTPIIKN